eukprot:scaffold1558_cov17-Tisochrysis_lutea.AAC.1
MVFVNEINKGACERTRAITHTRKRFLLRRLNHPGALPASGCRPPAKERLPRAECCPRLSRSRGLASRLQALRGHVGGHVGWPLTLYVQ